PAAGRLPDHWALQPHRTHPDVAATDLLPLDRRRPAQGRLRDAKDGALGPEAARLVPRPVRAPARDPSHRRSGDRMVRGGGRRLRHRRPADPPGPAARSLAAALRADAEGLALRALARAAVLAVPDIARGRPVRHHRAQARRIVTPIDWNPSARTLRQFA